MKKGVVFGLVLVLVVVIISTIQKPEVLPAPDVCPPDTFNYDYCFTEITRWEGIRIWVYDDATGEYYMFATQRHA